MIRQSWQLLVPLSIRTSQVNIVQMCTMQVYDQYSGLVPYVVPEWAAHLKGSPTHKVLLGHLNTPIHRWNLPGVPAGVQVYIKRDDMTGSTLSGNKVRKLEFLMAEALKKGCKHVITCGGIQSNHCRATAIAAAQFGMKTHLVLRASIEDVSEAGCQGNMLLNRMVGADMYFVPRSSRFQTELKPRQKMIADRIKHLTGEDSYTIPVGGSSIIGLHGYLSGFQELINQGVLENFDDIVFACGSGGTAEGLAIGNYLLGSRLKIHGIMVCSDANYFNNHVNWTLQHVGLDDKVCSEEILDLVEGYKGHGYGISKPDELEFIRDVGIKTGIMLDPVYTGKAAKGLVAELQRNPGRFQGKRILFIHTGGVFGMFDGKLDPPLLKDNPQSKLYMWNELSNPPFS